MTKNNTSGLNRKARRRHLKLTGVWMEATNVPVVEYPGGRKIMRANGDKKLSEIYGN